MIDIKKTSLLIKSSMKHINDDTKKPIIQESLNVSKCMCSVISQKQLSKLPPTRVFFKLKVFHRSLSSNVRQHCSTEEAARNS